MTEYRVAYNTINSLALNSNLNTNSTLIKIGFVCFLALIPFFAVPNLLISDLKLSKSKKLVIYQMI